jgi:hypothetical protein
MVCTASTTSCTGPADSNVIFNCTFPLWFIADPTSGTSTQTAKSNEFWVGAVAGIDNNNATGSMSTSTTGVEVLPLLAINLLSPQIAYDNQAPGTGMTNLTASTSLQVLGNTGIDQLLGGDSMCRNYSPNSPCANAASTTASFTKSYPEANEYFNSCGRSKRNYLLGYICSRYDFSFWFLHRTEHLLWTVFTSSDLVRYIKEFKIQQSPLSRGGCCFLFKCF